MREVITIHMGQCGCNIGSKFWEIVSDEHGVNSEGSFKGDSDIQLNHIEIYYRETSSGRFIPRTLIIDLNPTMLDNVRNSPIGNLFNPTNLVTGQSSACNNFAKGYYTDGPDILDNIMEILRSESEYCDSVQTFQMLHSIGGGTGSGLGSLLFNKIKEEFPDRIQSTVTVLPSESHSETVTESYNAMLAIDHLMATSNLVEMLDNDALYEMCMSKLKIEKASMADINHLISMATSGISSNLRFPGQLNTDFRKLSMNLIPFPRFVFLITAFAPFTVRSSFKHETLTLHSVTTQALDCKSPMIKCDPRKGKYVAVAVIYRGKTSMFELENEILNFQNKNSLYFVDWIPSNVKISSSSIPPRGMNLAMTFLGNNTAVQETFNRITDHYAFMYRRRAFLHWYMLEGVEEEEFHMAEDNILDLIDDYQRIAVHSTTDDL